MAGVISTLVERGFLVEGGAAAEIEQTAAKLGATYAPRSRRVARSLPPRIEEGAAAYSSAGAARTIGELAHEPKQRVDILLLGDCDIQMEADFLRREPRRAASICASPPPCPTTCAWRASISMSGADRRACRPAPDDARCRARPAPPHAVYILQARQLLEQLRSITSAPILIDDLPEPTVQPLGLAERGLNGHRTRFRTADVVLADLAASLPDVYVTDIAAAMAAIGSDRMIDDAQVGFTHLGSPGWLLQRPEQRKSGDARLFPDLKPLAQALDGDPYGREAAMADAFRRTRHRPRHRPQEMRHRRSRRHAVAGRPCRNRQPLCLGPDISGAFSYIGLYFGLHEALLASRSAASFSPACRRTTKRPSASCGAIRATIRGSVC